MYNHALIIASRQNADFGAGVMNRRNITLATAVSLRQTAYELTPILRKGFLHKITKYIDRAIGYLSDLKKEDILQIEDIIKKNPDIDAVFVMTSRWGLLAKRLKKMFPHIKLIFFFHNAEYVYSREEYRLNRTFKNFLYIYYFRHAEKMALHDSDFRFVLSRRDDLELKKIAPKVNNCILPMSIEDAGKIDYKPSTADVLQLLFVGSYFFANVEGLRWFAKNVMPRVNAGLTVVGSGMEALKDELTAANIQVLGRVESLKSYYEAADVVVSPIFSGSGMKTKTAEAMMYGLPVMGTDEAFAGYDVERGQIGRECNTSREFIEAINFFAENRELLAGFAQQSRVLFENNYSVEASLAIVKKCLFSEK